MPGCCSAPTPAAPAWVQADAASIPSAALCAAASRIALLWSHPEDRREKTLCCPRPGRIAEYGSWCVTTHFPGSPEAGLFCSCSADNSPYRCVPCFHGLWGQTPTQSLQNRPVVPVWHAQGVRFLFRAPVIFEDVIGVFSEEERNALEGVSRRSGSTADLTLLFDFDGFILPLPCRKNVCPGNKAGKVQVTCTNAVWCCGSWMQAQPFSPVQLPFLLRWSSSRALLPQSAIPYKPSLSPPFSYASFILSALQKTSFPPKRPWRLETRQRPCDCA